MDHYVGIDVSLEASSICVVDSNGKIIREGKVASEPGALIEWLRNLVTGQVPRPRSSAFEGLDQGAGILSESVEDVPALLLGCRDHAAVDDESVGPVIGAEAT